MMQNSRRAKIIADVIKHLEELDGSELKGSMMPKEIDIMVEGKPGPEGLESGGEGDTEGDMDSMGPMDQKLAAFEAEEKSETPAEEGDEMDEEELKELEKLSM